MAPRPPTLGRAPAEPWRASGLTRNVSFPQRLGGLVAPRYLWVPVDLELTALQVLASANEPGTAQNEINPFAEGDNSAVTTNKIDNEAVNDAKMAADAVGTATIKDGAITYDKLAQSLKDLLGI